MAPTGKHRAIRIFGAAEHNLRGIDVEIPRHTLTVLTGVSGSGKSSLAFDTIYAEGQRRYVESLSSYARQFLDQMPRPHVEHIEGLSPAISIEQKSVSHNPRSTVGTVTEIYDFLRLLFAYTGTAHCPQCGAALQRVTAADIVAQAIALPKGARLIISAPVVRGRKGEHRDILDRALEDGYERVKIDGAMTLITPGMKLERHKNHDVSIVIDRVIAGRVDRERLTHSIETALRRADGFAILETLPNADGVFDDDLPWFGERLFSEAIGCPSHGPQIIELMPRMFSFNSRFGACERCEGLGCSHEVDVDRLIVDPAKTIEEGAIAPWAMYLKGIHRLKRSQLQSTTLRIVETLERLGIPLDVPWSKIPQAKRDALIHGTSKPKKGAVEYEGLAARLKRSMEEWADEETPSSAAQYLREVPCPVCRGARLKPESLAVTIRGRSISDLCALPIGGLRGFFDGWELTDRQSQIARQPLREVLDRVEFLENVGLHYLSLGRSFATLSGGEAQRVRLATQIGTRLTGVLYILDEPSIGLHQRDNLRLIESLQRLRDLGNTVLVVEHDEQTIRAANHVLDLGPGAGSRGGHLVAAGPPEAVAAKPESLTGQYLTGTRSIQTPTKRRRPERGWLSLRGCTHHNLRGIAAEFPIGTMIGVTGVSGSGKSSLVVDTLLPLAMNHCYGGRRAAGAVRSIDGLASLEKVIHVDQSPIGRTPRSNPATYTKVFDTIRNLFAGVEEARLRGYGPGRFSFNVAGGRCPTCEGQGTIRMAMHFLPDVFVECESCKGARYSAETLEVKYRDRSIAEVLAMTVEEACRHFDGVAAILRPVETLRDVGLGYITLGQAATTFSGGEAQRIKLSRELSKRGNDKTLYVLDEPTTGLHFEDVRRLLEVLDRLVESGATVVVIEHNLDVIKCCDWLLDLGPEGGEGGGHIVAEGPPEAVAAATASHTGRFLRELLPPPAKAPAKKTNSRRT